MVNNEMHALKGNNEDQVRFLSMAKALYGKKLKEVNHECLTAPEERFDTSLHKFTLAFITK